jgi:hypothetical protein
MTANAQAPAPAAGGPPQPHGYGRIEWASVQGAPPIEIQAQLDGTADYTVLSAQDIKYASGEGGMYVHFTIDDGEVMPGNEISLSLPIIKDQHQRDRNGAVDHRPVVSMGFCIGDRAFTTSVTLVPRTSYTPPLVLSKTDAAQITPMDPQKKLTRHPECKEPEPNAQPAAPAEPAEPAAGT